MNINDPSIGYRDGTAPQVDRETGAVPLAICTAMMLRQFLPLTHGTPEEAEAATLAAANAQTDAERTARELKASGDALFAVQNAKRLRQLQAEQGIEPPKPDDGAQAALDALNAQLSK